MSREYRPEDEEDEPWLSLLSDPSNDENGNRFVNRRSLKSKALQNSPNKDLSIHTAKATKESSCIEASLTHAQTAVEVKGITDAYTPFIPALLK